VPLPAAPKNTVPGFARRSLREMAASMLESTVRRGSTSRGVLVGGDRLHDLAEQWRYGGSLIDEVGHGREAFDSNTC